jgi:phosphoribosylaminoimidazole-succinocarboxamide synthase
MSTKLIPYYEGKAANVFKLTDNNIILQRTDRLSGLNVRVINTLPMKGVVLNQLSKWWMIGPLKHIVGNHLLEYFDYDFFIENGIEDYFLNSVVAKKLTPIKTEAIVRGYITGTGFKAYLETGEVCGIKLPVGLKEWDKLEKPIFTPTEKTETDDHYDFEEMSNQIGIETAEYIRMVSLDIFEFASKLLYNLGIILVDSKFEFGFDKNKNILLMDEVLTPDSSRFLLREPFEKEKKIVSLDKQKARDWLTKQKTSGNWDGKSPIELPEELMSELSDDYVEIYERITGEKLVLV